MNIEKKTPFGLRLKYQDLANKSERMCTTYPGLQVSHALEYPHIPRGTVRQDSFPSILLDFFAQARLLPPTSAVGPRWCSMISNRRCCLREIHSVHDVAPARSVDCWHTAKHKIEGRFLESCQAATRLLSPRRQNNNPVKARARTNARVLPAVQTVRRRS